MLCVAPNGSIISIMGNKVLILGCSFSNGSYEAKVPSKWGELAQDERVSSFGWYDGLACFSDRSIDVYSMPGLGWLAYAHLIRSLDEQGKLAEYDTLIIQETFEPRVYLMGDLFLSGFIESDKIDRTLNIRHLSYQHPPGATVMSSNANEGVVFYKTLAKNNNDAFLLPGSLSNRIVSDLSESGFIRTILLSSQALVESITKKQNIRMILLSFADPCMPCDPDGKSNPVRIINNVYSEFCLPKRNEYLTDPTPDFESYGGHLTRNGNELLGSRFDFLIKRLL